jgi:hypothetical protein
MREELTANQVVEAFKALTIREEKDVLRRILEIQPLIVIADAVEDLDLEELVWILKDSIDFEASIERYQKEKREKEKARKAEQGARRREIARKAKFKCAKCASPYDPYIQHAGCKKAAEVQV